MLRFRPLTTTLAAVLATGAIATPFLAPHVLAATPMAPNAIVYQNDNGREWEIVAIRPGDASPRRILQRDGISFTEPTWSPDGTHIAFQQKVNGPNWRLVVMRADGTDVRRVSSRQLIGKPSWSPDSTQLAFASPVAEIVQLFTIDVSGSGLTQVTHAPKPSTVPVWSPDGTRLFHVSSDDDEIGNRVFVVNVNGTGRQAVADVRTHSFALSPDGTTLAVGIVVDGINQVHLMPATGGELEQVTDEPHDQFVEDWSPDGTRLLVFAYTGATVGTMVSMALDGGDVEVIKDFVQEAGDWGTPAFVDSIDHSLAEHISWAVAMGITSGCDIAEFCPNRAVTRGELAAVLASALGLPATDTDHFTDDSGPFEVEINRLAEAGLVKGCAPSRFCPDAIVTRGQSATILDRALDLPGTTVDAFGDDEGTTHEIAINRLAAAGIASGCAPFRFCPSAGLTRAQFVTLLHRALT